MINNDSPLPRTISESTKLNLEIKLLTEANFEFIRSYIFPEKHAKDFSTDGRVLKKTFEQLFIDFVIGRLF